MRKKIVAANWKMNKSFSEGLAFSNEFANVMKENTSSCQVILCVPFIHLSKILSLLKDTNVFVGAQDCSSHKAGAYTGEISAEMIRSTGASNVIIGHSERRMYHHEDTVVLKEKIQQALLQNLTPIFCVGEQLTDRENGQHLHVVGQQLSEALFDISAEDFSKIILAYEPVWAIGTGKTASADDAQEVHAHLRGLIQEKYGAEIATNCSILYGGSCNEKNANELFSMPDIDGGLIGGASLNVHTFLPIITAMDKLSPR